MKRPPRWRRWLFAAVAAGLPCGCGGSEPADMRTQLVVFAASSLVDAFADLEHGFELDHPRIDVRLSSAGSQVLRLQLEHGARADVFASADQAHATALQASGVVGLPQPFAHNDLVLIVPRNSSSVATFDDLPKAQRVVLGRPDVPAGAYARQVLERARAQQGADFASRVESHIVSEEHNVRLVRAKVELGEADAAIVYRTDTRGRSTVRTVPIPDAMNVRATYVAAVVRTSASIQEAHVFVEYLRSSRGQAILAKHGFLKTGGGAP